MATEEVHNQMIGWWTIHWVLEIKKYSKVSKFNGKLHEPDLFEMILSLQNIVPFYTLIRSGKWVGPARHFDVCARARIF